MSAGQHRFRGDSSTSWLVTYVVGGLYLCACLTYAVMT
jgi:hypothetical protein